MVFRALNKCHKECPFCARDYFKWLKTREAQMSHPTKGMSVSFAQAAATSVKVED